VYGGGGIFPDIPLAERAPRPRWALRAEEQQLPLAWSGGYVEAHGASLASLESFAAAGKLPPAALVDFRTYAAHQGVVIPTDADEQLQAMLVTSVAEARWGSEGAYRVEALHDTAVRDAIASFSRATQLLR
jgi:hypothetical protein